MRDYSRDSLALMNPLYNVVLRESRRFFFKLETSASIRYIGNRINEKVIFFIEINTWGGGAPSK